MGATLKNCYVTVNGGGYIGSEIVQGGSVTLNTGAKMYNCTCNTAARIYAAAGATIQSGSFGHDAYVSGSPTTILSGVIITSGTMIGGTLTGAGTVETVAGGTVSNQSVGSGAKIVVSGGLIQGTISLQAGGSAVLNGQCGGTVSMANGSYAEVTLSAGALPTTMITGFNGQNQNLSDQIRIVGVKRSDVASVEASGNKLTFRLKTGRTFILNIQNVGTTGYSLLDNASGLTVVACYLAGTLIRTPDGDVVVEALKVGDSVTAIVSGRKVARQVIWVGRGRKIVDPTLADDEAGYPVCIKAGAISEAVPEADMYVTAEHCVLVNDSFIPVRMLVNGVNIFYDRTKCDYAYFHFETKKHSVVVADGICSESYLDTGNRKLFDFQSTMPLDRMGNKTWECDAAAPLVTRREFVEPIYRSIACRAGLEDVPSRDLTDDAGLRLETPEGDLIYPLRRNEGRYSFLLPPLTRFVRILSRKARPADVHGPFLDDRRELGVLVGKVELYSADRFRTITAHLEALEIDGWHPKEGTTCRWTKGSGFLFIPDGGSEAGGVFSLEVLQSRPYPAISEESSYAGLCKAG